MNNVVETSRELIESQQGLVRSLAIEVLRKFPSQIELDDLVAYGQLGLAEAARDFDPARGNQFSTYAYYRIRGAIYDGLAKMNWSDPGARRRARFQNLAGEVLALEGQDSPADSPSAAGEAAWLERVTKRISVAYIAVGATDGVDGQALHDETAVAPSSSVFRSELIDRLNGLISELPEDERQIVLATYFEGKTLQEAALRLGISKSWASRLHARSLDRLATSLRRIGLGD